MLNAEEYNLACDIYSTLRSISGLLEDIINIESENRMLLQNILKEQSDSSIKPRFSVDPLPQSLKNGPNDPMRPTTCDPVNSGK